MLFPMTRRGTFCSFADVGITTTLVSPEIKRSLGAKAVTHPHARHSCPSFHPFRGGLVTGAGMMRRESLAQLQSGFCGHAFPLKRKRLPGKAMSEE